MTEHTARHGPVFIVGCERSGTTLLRAMLNAHPHIAIPYEAHRFSKKVVSVSSPWTHVWASHEVEVSVREFLNHPKVRFWGLHEAAVMQELRAGASFRYSDILRAIYGAYAKREGKQRWGDKTPWNTFDLPELIQAFPDAQFVHIVRDGRDVYLSWSQVDWVRYDVEAAAKRWRGWVWAAYRPGERLGSKRYYQLRYEALIRRPCETLKAICQFLGEPFVENMLDYHTNEQLVPEEDRKFHQLLSRPPATSRVYRWKQEMQVAEVTRFERIAGPTLIKYGYDVVSPGLRIKAYAGFVTQRVRQRIKDALNLAS